MDELDRMGFPVSDEARALRDLMMRFGQDRLHPGAADRDRSHAFPDTEIRELARMGGMAMKVGVEDNGPGVDNLTYVLAIEAISRWDASVGVVMVASNLAAAILARHASPEQRARYVAPAARGDVGALSFALTEPGAGSDAAAIRTTARRDGDGWVLNGTKQWITGASHAGLFVVFARTPDEGENAITCFVVTPDTPGFSLGRIEEKMGLTSSGTAVLHFDDARLPADAVIGTAGQGLQVALSAIAPSRLAIAAQSIGIAERAFDLGRSYAQDRSAFGQRIADFQATQFTLADARTRLDQCWLLMLRGAVLLDRGVPIRAEASMAKLAASEACGEIVDAMLQLHGGNGYSRDYEIERLYRDARVMRIFEGTSEIQRTVIAREVMRPNL